MRSAGDLGAASSDVECSLSLILEMVTNRTRSYYWMNAMFSPKHELRTLLSATELSRFFYRLSSTTYERVLFLTTNRINNLDPAFQSRTHSTINYTYLDKNAREKIWRNFLSRREDQERHQITDFEVGQLADVDINGRQIIKNLSKTAKLLATHKNEHLKFAHVQTVMGMEANWE